MYIGVRFNDTYKCVLFCKINLIAAFLLIKRNWFDWLTFKIHFN